MKKTIPFLMLVLASFSQSAFAVSGGSPVEFKIQDTTVLSVDSVQDVKLTKESSTGTWGVALTLLPEDASLFEKITQNNVGEKLAVIVDDKVVLSPKVMTGIHGGHISITAQSKKIADRLFKRLKKIEVSSPQN